MSNAICKCSTDDCIIPKYRLETFQGATGSAIDRLEFAIADVLHWSRQCTAATSDALLAPFQVVSLLAVDLSRLQLS